MKRSSKIVIILLVFVLSQVSWAQETAQERMIPKPLVDSAILGVGAGILCGLLLLPRDGWTGQNIMKGASLGLYGGVALGLYLSYGSPAHPHLEEEPSSSEKQSSSRTLLSLGAVESESKVTGASIYLSWFNF